MAGTSATNVQVGKPNLAVSGGILKAPVGTTRPTDATTALDAAYVSLGYVSDDGVTLTQDRSTEDIRAWGGTKIRTIQTEFGESLQLTLIESRNADALKAVFGEDNVTVTATSVSVKHNEQVSGHAQFVVDMKDGDGARRLDVGNGQVVEVGDVSYVDGEAISYEITISADPDADGNALIEYVDLGTSDDSGE